MPRSTRGRIHIAGVAAARSGARRRPNLKRQLSSSCTGCQVCGGIPVFVLVEPGDNLAQQRYAAYAGLQVSLPAEYRAGKPKSTLPPDPQQAVFAAWRLTDKAARKRATRDLERGPPGSWRRYIGIKAFGLVASRAAIMTGTRCRSRDTLVALATPGWKLLKDWCRRKRRQAFRPRFLTLPLLADFLGHTKNISGGEMDSSHGHAVDVEIRVSPVPDGEGGSWRILGPRRSVTGFAAGFAERNWQRLRFRLSRPMASAAVIGRLSSVGLGAPV